MYPEDIQKLLEKQGIKVGDLVKIRVHGKEFEGTLMPKPESGSRDSIILKFANGYNVGLKIDAGFRIEKIRSQPAVAFPSGSLRFNPSLSKVEMIYTGGTIGSKIDYLTGGVHMLTKPDELLYDVPELAEIAEIRVNNLMSIASEDISYMEWQKIAKSAADALNKGAEGVIITMGTDTMHYTSAALSFMLDNLNAPVVITGAQRSSDRGSSDAFTNLISAAYLASRSNIAEVGICMHTGISDNEWGFLRGTKVRKMHTTRRDAFKPVNSKPIATVDSKGEIRYISAYKKVDDERADAKVNAVTKFEPKVALHKVYPNSSPELLDYYVEKGYKGVILEVTGMGHAPVSTRHAEYNWLGNIKRAVEAGTVIGITSQCLYGRVNSTVYRNARLMSSAGAIYCEDMLPEVAYVKLGFLLGNYSKEKSEELLCKDISGEITKRSEIEV